MATSQRGRRFGALRGVAAYRPLVVLLAIGLAIRAAVMALYWPGLMINYDTPRFARVSPPDLFGDFWMPAGYPAFLKVVRHISDQVWFSIALQHLLGLVAAAVLFAATRRAGAPRWLALIPAGVVVFSGDHLYLEHILMADTFLIFIGSLGLAAIVYGLVPRADWRWLLAGGALLGAAGLVRSPALILPPVAVLCALLWAPRGVRSRLLGAGAVAAGALVMIGLYLGAFALKHGKYTGLNDMSGWNLYSRVAPFADCHDFTPPRGTRVLCEQTPPAQRPGPFYYVWDAGSISRRTFEPLSPQTGAPLQRFAEAALLAQPKDYLFAVASDFVRYFEPVQVHSRPLSGQPRDIVSFAFRDAQVEALVSGALAQRYHGTTVHAPGAGLLGRYQDLVRVDRLVLLAALVLTLLGIVRARGSLRLGATLFGLSALGLYLVPVLTVSYDFRYGIPPETFLVVSAVLGAFGLFERSGRTLRRA